MCSENTVPSHVLQPLFTEGRVCVSFTALTDFIVLNLAHFSSLSGLGNNLISASLLSIPPRHLPFTKQQVYHVHIHLLADGDGDEGRRSGSCGLALTLHGCGCLASLKIIYSTNTIDGFL